MTHDGLRVETSPGKGRGVFALRRFDKGEVIERCPVLVLSPEDADAADDTALQPYLYEWGSDGESRALPLGYGAIYNHSLEPNAWCEMDLERREMTVVALRDVAPGDEIVLNYNGEPEDRSGGWFDGTDPERVGIHR
ncbi:MAG TPA: SET domain-containing protein [Candidatus Limnocylindria bacterium]